MSAAPGQARAGSIEAVDAFRAHLVVYLARAGAVPEEFREAMKTLRQFVEASNQHAPYLLRKAQRIEEYLQQR